MSYPAFVVPRIIPPTFFSGLMMDRVIQEYREAGWKFVELHGLSATRFPLFATLQYIPQLNILMYAGHGTPIALCGESILCDLITVEDVNWLKGKVISAIPACHTAVTLGREAVERGAKAFFGSEDAMFVAWKEWDHDYLSDWNDCMITFYRSLMYKTFGEALEDYKNRFTHYIELYKKKLVDWPNAEWYISSFRRNRDGVILIGNPSDKLPPPLIKVPVEVDVLTIIRNIIFGFSLPLALFLASTLIAPPAVRALMK